MRVLNMLAVAACCVLSMAFSANAQTPNSSPTPTPFAQGSNNEKQVAVLEAQLEIMRNYDERLISTVYWALGGMITVVIVIVGVGWYTNFRIYERDKSAIRQELLSLLREDIRSTIEASSAKTRAELESAVTSRAAESENKIAKLQKELNHARYKLLQIEADKHESESVYRNVLRTYVEMIRVAQELEYDFYVSRCVENVVRVLKVFANANYSGSSLTGDLASDVTKMTDSLTNEYSADADTIRALLRSARAK
jgi:hypothetical protein